MNKTTLILIIIGAIIMTAGTGAAVVAYSNSTRRGLRNNNPGNLVRSKLAWKGKVPHALNKDPHFEQFRDEGGVPGHLWGLRAMFMDIRGDIEKDGLNTVAKLISSYAPAMGTLNPTGQLKRENDTAAYIRVVAAALKKTPSAMIERADYLTLMKAIIRHENGEQPYPDAVITKAMQMA